MGKIREGAKREELDSKIEMAAVHQVEKDEFGEMQKKLPSQLLQLTERRWVVVTKQARELDAESIICSTPEKNIGIQQSLKECLKKQIENLVQVNPSIQGSGDIDRVIN